MTGRSPWLDDADYDVAAFRELGRRTTDPAEVPYAVAVERNVPIYDGDALHDISRDPRAPAELLGELAWVLGQGPGVLAVQGGARPAAAPASTRRPRSSKTIIAEQHAAGRGDRRPLRQAGLERPRVELAREARRTRDPTVFAAYYSADAIALGCEAWLGPHYQISAQVNRINPGGTAQSPHRDYHVGFYEPEQMERFPRHVHLMSQALTLQGAVAHTDMPLESGPTMLLPFSQLCAGRVHRRRCAPTSARCSTSTRCSCR